MAPRNRPPVMRAVRTPEAIQRLLNKLGTFDYDTSEDGREALDGGAVAHVWSEADHLVKAEVNDDRLLELTWFFTRGEWTCRCSCDTRGDCAHAYASGFAWITAVESGARDGRDPGDTPTPPSTRFTQAVTSKKEHALEAELARWLVSLPDPDDAVETGTPTGFFADLNGLRVRLDNSGNWNIEVRRGLDKPWRSPAQRWINDLAKLRPADFESLDPAEGALASALAAETRISPTGISAKRALPIEAVVGLLRTKSARAALCLPDGRPLEIEPEPLVPEAVIADDDPDRFDLHIVTPEGHPADGAIMVAAEPRPLYLFDGHLWHGPPPTPAKRLPAAALSDARLLPRLKALGLRLPHGVQAELRNVTLKPKLKCWLTPGFDGEERELHAQLTAESNNPACSQQWTNDTVGWRWRKDSAPPPRVVGEPAIQFDLVKARAASTSFTGFRFMWDGWADAWTRSVNDGFAEDFLDWHKQLSPDLNVELSPELASLLDAPLSARVELDVIEAPDSEQDWFDLTVGLKVEDTKLSAEDITLLLKARGKWVNLPRHGWKRIAAEAAIDAKTAAALDRLGLGVEDVLLGGKPTKHRVHALQLALESAALADRDARMVERLKERAAEIAAKPVPELPKSLKATLRPYQLEGFHFLGHLSDQRFGGVLADDMGLGKTVQALAWFLHLAAQPLPAGKIWRALVVCPKSVIHGWLTETARFAPTLAIDAFTPEGTNFNQQPEHPHVLVANYTQLRRHSTKFRSVKWDVVVLDEGQFIKNPTSQVALAARGLPARHRLVLTGTPIENRLSDLWSLFAFAQPGLLGDHTSFRKQYNDASADSLARLHRRVTHFLLRRTKAQAAPDLPLRTEDEIIVALEPGQQKLYDAELKRARAELLGVETAKELNSVRFHVLASLLRLRQICCHPALVDPVHAHLPSAKLEALLERVEELADEGHQVLVFSQFVKMLHIIRDRLVESKIGHLILTGSTENRAELVDTFQSDPSKTVFLLSLKAAGFGLNLTAASYAILYDPWWNPAAEAQAIDRIHRIGQTKPVIAYRLITAGSVEEKIRSLQHEKAALAAAVVQEDSLKKVLDLDSLRSILS